MQTRFGPQRRSERLHRDTQPQSLARSSGARPLKAAIVPRYGPPDVVRLEDLPDPTPAPGEVLVRVRATTVASGDARIRGFDMPGILFWIPARLALGVRRPRRRVLGTEFAGVVDAVGDNVTRFTPGDRVFGMASFSKPTGAHAELLTIAAEGMIEPMPAGMTFEEAGCLCFGLHTADHFLLKGAKIQPGERVMIIGASGAVGCAAVQLAKHADAHVTAVCSTRHIDLMHSLGADAVIDYTKESYTDQGDARARYDLVFDTVGATSPSACRGVLAQNGRFIALVLDGKTIIQTLWYALSRRMKVLTGVAA
ncbi:MAG: NAD(P)-dependent alcohol dehydrogenase, partial [Phycisphaerales bacterium]